MSDLDIICSAHNFPRFMHTAKSLFSDNDAFYCKQKKVVGTESVVCRFMFKEWPVEIVCQHLPIEHQRAYGHMLAEADLIYRHGPEVNSQVRELKLKGYSTEEAFGLLFDLPGDPYQALMERYCKEFNIEL